MTSTSLPWVALLGLGAWHGINPGMGWLFAVALGMQEGRARAVWRALAPLALGHALAVGLAVVVVVALGVALPHDILPWLVAAVLFGFGLFRIMSNRHPRFGGMRVTGRDLIVWSLLMASAHGAGLMVVPFLMGPGSAGAHAGHHAVPMMAGGGMLGASGLTATLLHTAGYIFVTGLVAVIVYQWAGLRQLRRWWLNLDVLWAVALIGTAVFTVLR
jgi:hypothetical protein